MKEFAFFTICDAKNAKILFAWSVEPLHLFLETLPQAIIFSVQWMHILKFTSAKKISNSIVRISFHSKASEKDFMAIIIEFQSRFHLNKKRKQSIYIINIFPHFYNNRLIAAIVRSGSWN